MREMKTKSRKFERLHLSGSLEQSDMVLQILSRCASGATTFFEWLSAPALSKFSLPRYGSLILLKSILRWSERIHIVSSSLTRSSIDVRFREERGVKDFVKGRKAWIIFNLMHWDFCRRGKSKSHRHQMLAGDGRWLLDIPVTKACICVAWASYFRK